jgi:NitT/TauT family transport system substrate-binding protein
VKRGRAAALLASAPLLRPAIARSQTALIRVATAPADSYAEPFFAVDAGIFSRAGLNVQLIVLPNGGAIAQAMAGNAVDVGIGDPINVAHAINAGFPLAVLAGGGMYLSGAPTTLLLVPKASPLSRPKDLEGQTVAVVALASISSLGLQEWLRANGVDVTKVNLIEMPFPEMVPAMGRGRVSAALLSEPFITDGRDETRTFGKVFDAVAKSFYITTWFAPASWIAKNQDLARHLVQTVYDTARWSNSHHADTAPILAKYTKLDLARTQSMTRVNFATSLDPRQLQPVIDAAYRHNQLQQPVRATDIIARL